MHFVYEDVLWHIRIRSDDAIIRAGIQQNTPQHAPVILHNNMRVEKRITRSKADKINTITADEKKRVYV